jgi:integrative and conjugative element protein (TIGR02256 family)
VTYTQVEIAPAARTALLAHARSARRRETGGILAGYEVNPNTVRITRASPPGPRAIRLPHFFLRDKRFLQRWIDRVIGDSDQEGYVGEWHVHRALHTTPSFVDRRSMWRIARRSNYPVDTSILIIVERSDAQARLTAYWFQTTPTRATGELTLIEGR